MMPLVEKPPTLTNPGSAESVTRSHNHAWEGESFQDEQIQRAL